MSHLPWQQIPKFVPGVTDVEDYTKRMEFLKELWPAEHLALLGPRAALQVEGSAFQKVRRIAPDKLRGTDGVKLLVEALGGSWGRTAVEDKYYHFEQAMFQTNQKADESNDSYIARHDVHFEELISKNVTIEEIRAYVLLRHSQLSAEDKKRVVVEAQGNLSYANTVKAVRLLGSKFFTELQGRGTSAAGRPAERQKVYETNFTEEEVGEYDADINFAADSEDDLWVAHMCEMGDEDAIYVAEFEDQIIEAVQDSELAPIYSAYQEARLKLKEKAKARGFWPKGHGKGGGKYGSSRKGRGKSGPRYKTLADRIANSTCRRCGQQGHWKRECPRNADNQRNEVSNFTQAAMEEEDLPEILQTLPDGAEDFEMITEHPGQARTGHAARQSDERIQYSCHFPCLLMATPKVSVGSRVKEVIARRLLMLDRTTRHQKTSRTPAPGNPLPEDCILGKGPSLCSSSSSHFGRTCPETVLVVTEGSEGVLDTGASRTVVGLERLQEVLQGLSERCRKGIKRVSSEITFRFGNSGTLSSKYALLLPSSSGSWVRLEVIPGHTPLLISNKLLREMDAVIHVRKGFVQVGQVWVPTRFAKDDQGEDRGLRERGLGHCGNRPGDGLREEGPKQSQAKDDGEAHHPKDVEGDKLEHDRGRDHRDGEDDDCYAQGAPTPGAGDSGAVAAAAEQSRRRRGRGLGVKQQSAKATTMGEDIQKLCGQIDHKIKTIEGQLLEGAGHVIHETASRYRLPSLDVLEIAPKVGNMVSAAVQKCGGRALCLKGHQLDSAKGSCGRLRQIFDMYQPTHVWIDVRQPWLGTRSRDSKDWWPWRVLLDLYHSQIESGRHFHMCCGPQFFEEAPPEFAEIQQGMLMAVHNPQELEGHKKVPTGNNFYRRRTIIHTTSRAIHQALDTRPAVTEPQRPSSSHNHDKPQRKHLLQQSLGTRAAPALLSNGGLPLLLSELLLGEGSRELPQEDLEAAQQVLKRRRLWGKQSPPEQNAESSGASKAVTWERIFTEVNDRVPKGGGMAVEEGDAITSMVQQLLPDFQVQQVVFCRGTNRVQPPKGSWVGKDIPLRQTVVVRRDNGKVELDGALEEWTKVPRYKQCRAIIPARMSATVYGIQLHDPYVQPVHRSESSGSDEGPEMQIDDPAGSAVEVGAPEGLVQGFPPKMIPRHGPGFLGLNEEERGTIMRLHNNLGHPSPELFAKFLGERKAEPEMIRAARDYSCSVCQETVSLPKLSRPSAVHVDGDFGDTIGMDVAYWTNSAGKTFMFTHVLDEATLFEQAEATGRTQQEQFEVLADHWFRWAGPCKTLYVDPAGEYTGDQWRDRLQQEGIQAHVSAGEAHWQLGRVESHGKIIKAMLTRMDRQDPIATEAEFRRCLRQAVHSKNSLSRVRGFTPEQAVLGKMSRLPASLTADSQASSHALAESNTPEGVRFRQDLARREQARVAFIQADNDSSYRRALLRRSRPSCQKFDAGDWVLYWRRHKGGSRGERGRWYGPSQVICSDPKVVWLSHCGRLIRAAPEQLRSASMREWKAMAQQLGNSATLGSVGQGVRGVVDLVGQGELPSRAEVDDQGDSPIDLPEATDVEPEAGEAVEINTGATHSGETTLAEQPEMEVSPVPSLGSSHAPENDGNSPPENSLPEWVSVPIPEEDDDDDILFGDTEVFFAHPTQGQAWEITLHETAVPSDDLPSESQALHYVMLASTERKKRVEVRLKDCSAEEMALFRKAKDKEVGAWLDHRTVRKVAGGTLDDSQLMRCRWILTWKPPEKEGLPRRAKARLVVLGFEDPNIQDIPNDAPTLSKDARQLILQKVVSNKWKLVNFDVSTAFLQGKGDGRKLGIRPPEELKQALKMKPGDQCLLEGGAYGRIDAPFLWFQTFKETLEGLGFVQSPFDACTFSLVTPGPDNKPLTRGVLGIHVDDGIGGGDSYFTGILEKLRGIYSFGSYDEGEFTFTGIRFRQWDDSSVEMDQTQYIEKIDPVHVPKHRRNEPSSRLTAEEVHELRRLNGSLQYAAVHTRPDLAAKVGILQSAVNRAEVRHLLEANRVLYEAKASPVSLMVVPIPEPHVTFCTFSDASFATSKDSNSYQGTLVVATDWRMLANEKAVIVPVAWSSRKIARVVRSTLSAEVVSLCGSVDRMSWLRLFWEWLKSPDIDLCQPDEVLKQAPRATLVTDCKSAYDIATKTAVPSCSELRTQLECLLLRERLQENCQMRWVHSKAMLADCLTKVMDSSELRRRLGEGRYALFDETSVLENRAGKRQSLKWLRSRTQEHK